MKKSFLCCSLAIFGLTLAGCSPIETILSTSSDNSNASIVTSSIPDVDIKEEFSVESVQFVDGNFDSIDYCFVNDANVNILITLDNYNSYDVIGINDSLDYALNKIDDNNYYIHYDIDSEYGVKTFSLNSVSYSNDETNKLIPTNLKTNIFSCKEGTQKIKTADQLLDMNEGYYYELMNDIDLSEFDWSNPGEFSGVFNGHDYSINNMTAEGTASVSDTDIYLGLFSQCNSGAVIFDLNIEKASFLVNALNETKHRDIYYGAVIGKCTSNFIRLKNCSTNIDIAVITNTYVDTFIGGVIGGISNSDKDDGVYRFDNCLVTSNANLVAISGNSIFGGVVGLLSNYGDCRFANCFVTSIINSCSFNLGGIVGDLYNYGNCCFTECSLSNITKAYGDESIMIGGIAAYLNNIGNCYFNNCSTTSMVELDKSRTLSFSKKLDCSILYVVQPNNLNSGGIVGSLDNLGNCFFDSCATTSIIESSYQDEYWNDMLGGIIGNSIDNLGIYYFTDCYVEGNLSSGFPLAYLFKKYSVENCTANITIGRTYINSIPNENTINN